MDSAPRIRDRLISDATMLTQCPRFNTVVWEGALVRH